MRGLAQARLLVEQGIGSLLTRIGAARRDGSGCCLKLNCAPPIKQAKLAIAETKLGPCDSTRYERSFAIDEVEIERK